MPELILWLGGCRKCPRKICRRSKTSNGILRLLTTRSAAGRRAASMWRIMDGWFTAPKFVSVSSTVRWAQQSTFFFLMTVCRNVRNRGVKENKDYTATTPLRSKSSPTMAKPMVTHHASHPCANPASVRSRKNNKTKQVESNRMWLQPPNTMKLAAGFDALVGCERSNTFSKKRTAACVWTCLHRLWLWNSLMRKPQGTERVRLIPGTDRGLAGSSRWELQFVKVVTQQLGQ